MRIYNQSPLEEISTDTLRSNLRRVLDKVKFYDARYLVLRRGRPVAGIVPYMEARALFKATRPERRFVHVQLQQEIEAEDHLRSTLQDISDEFGR